MRPLLALVLFACAMALTYDGCTYGLMPADPASGRTKGCYTAIERWAGIKRESWIRTAEQLGAGSALLAAIVVMVRARRATT